MDLQLRDRPGEFLEKLPSLYEAANRDKMSLTQFLEQEDPSHKWDGEDRNLKAFGRVLQASGLRFRSDPANGLYADTCERIWETEAGKWLFPEWARSVWRRTIYDGGYSPQVRSIFGSTDDVVGTILRPYTDKPGVTEQLLTPALRLDDIVAMTTPIDGTDYRSAYLDEPSAAGVRLSRIAEKADIPMSNITLSSHIITLQKYGRGIQISYEAARRARVDKVAFWLARAALQVEADRVAQGIDVLINGDGNPSTAATNYTQGGLDTGTTLTVKAYLAWKSKWRPPYRLTHIFSREAESVNLQLLQFPNQNPYMFQSGSPLQNVGGLTPMQDLLTGNVVFGQSDQVPATVYLGIDARQALERITENGSQIEETKQFVERQTNALYFTENDGFGILDNLAAKTLTMA